VLGSLALFLGFGLVGLGASVLISALLGRVLALYFFLNHVASKQAVLRVAKCSRPLLKKLWHNAGRLGIVQVGAFLIQRGNILIASSFLGLEAASSYSLSVTILMSLSAVSSVVCQLQVPHVSALQVRGARGELIGIYGEMVLLSGFVFAVGAITITLFGNFFLSGIGSQVSLLSFNHMVVLGLVLMLELHHSVAATYLTTLNIVPFVKAGVLSGIAVLALSLLLIQPFGMLGLIISQGMTQILYNNWKWPLEVLRSLRAGFAETLFSGGGRFVRKFFKVG
jgi:O-antigen/teichoic acid export membrane protein